MTTRWSKLEDLATIERAKTGKEYPAGAVLVQIHATRGQVVEHQGGTVESKYAVVQTKGIPQKFLYYAIKNHYPDYFEKTRRGLNYIPEDLKALPIPTPRTNQECEDIADYFTDIDTLMELQKEMEEQAKRIKVCMLGLMFPNGHPLDVNHEIEKYNIMLSRELEYENKIHQKGRLTQ